MSSHAPRIEFAVGAFLLLALASLLVLALASTNGKLGWFGGNAYEITARFTNLGPLRANAPVKIGGVNVGRVSAITLDPVKLDSVVTLAIDARYDDLPADTSAAILTSGLLGESYVGLQPGGDPEPLREGDQIFLTQSSVDLIQMVGKYMFSGGGDNGGDPAAPSSEATEVPAYLQEADPVPPTE